MDTHESRIRDVDIIPLPAFRDNYIWALRHENRATVVDPGDAEVVERWLRDTGVRLSAILLTHHHSDHVGGVAALRATHDVPVYGPADAGIAAVTHPVGEGDTVDLPELGESLNVLEVPGHTATHIAYYAPGMLFCGDTLFSAGCGRLLGGTAAQLHASLTRLAALPGDTAVFCTHEYTLANLAFSQHAEPINAERDAWIETCRALCEGGQPTLPSRIDRERAINPFLRCSEPGVIDAVTQHNGARPADAAACFAALRGWKDVF